MFRCQHVIASALIILGASTQATFAQSRFAVGLLECRAGPSTSFVVGSVRDFDCIFRPDGAPPQRYGATIQRIGLDLGWSNDASLVWQVFAPTVVIGPGALSGSYGGGSGGGRRRGGGGGPAP